jgi:SAM-dependent methyltransferase
VSCLTTWLDRTLYPAVQKNWDDEMFRHRLLQHMTAASICLDYGAGRGNVKQMNFRGVAGRVVGIDPEAAVFNNPFLDEAALLDLQTGRIPFPDQTFDVVFADNVMEHVEDPRAVLREVYRVLKPGGVFLAKTPNRWHYMPIVARITPTWFHRAYNRARGRNLVDTFPTRYRCNTERAVCGYAAESGFAVEKISLIEGRPEYLRIFALSYLAGWLWERAVNSTQALKGLRCVLVFELRKA